MDFAQFEKEISDLDGLRQEIRDREARLHALTDWKDRVSFGKKCLYNIAAAGMFSSDRAIRQYAETIWELH